MKTLTLWLSAFALAGVLSLTGASAQDRSLAAPAPDGLRKGGTIHETMEAQPIAGDPREVQREVRNYPEQPPVIPHVIRDYQVDRRFNKCLDCHSRLAAPDAGAPMVSVTHFMDRDNQVRAEVTPGRYFCTQCHVTQTDADELVENEFLPVNEVIRRIRERDQ